MDDNFRLVIYRACQRAELALITPRHKSYTRTIPVLGSDGPKTAHGGPRSEAQVQLQSHNILRHPLHLDVVSWFPELSSSVSSASADSQTLVIKTTNRGSTFITSWDFNEVGTKWDPKPISSYFDAEELSQDPQYVVLGCLVARLVIANYESASDFHSQTYWEVISPYSDAALARRSASTFVSIHDILTSHFHHYAFEQSGAYKFLLYTSGIIVIDIQAMALMRIDVNTTEHNVPHTWIGINEGGALEYNSLQCSFSSPELDRGGVPGQLVVSKDGLTLAHLYQYGGVHQDPAIILRLWNTTTGAILSTHNIGLHEQETAHLIGISANDVASLLTRRLLDSSLHIIPSDDDAAIDLIHLEEVIIPRMVFFPDERRIAYKIRDEIVIRDIKAKQDIFHHPFTFDEEPLDIVITPDGKTLITVHSTHFRTWRVEA